MADLRTLLAIYFRSHLRLVLLLTVMFVGIFGSVFFDQTDFGISEVPVLFPLFLVIIGPMQIMNHGASARQSGWSYYLSLGRGRWRAFLLVLFMACGYPILLLAGISATALIIDPSLILLSLLSWVIILGYLLAIGAIVFGTNTGNVVWARALIIIGPILIVRSQGDLLVMEPGMIEYSRILPIAAAFLAAEAILFAFGYWKFSQRDF